MKRSLLSALAALALWAGSPECLRAGEVIYEGGGHGGGYGGGGHGGTSYGGDASYPGRSTWHSGYYHVMWGKPLALVLPPTLTHQTNWGWGVGNTRVTPIYPQYSGPMMSNGYGGGEAYRPTPFYPSDTLQFGVYYIRGPW